MFEKLCPECAVCTLCVLALVLVSGMWMCLVCGFCYDFTHFGSPCLFCFARAGGPGLAPPQAAQLAQRGSTASAYSTASTAVPYDPTPLAGKGYTTSYSSTQGYTSGAGGGYTTTSSSYVANLQTRNPPLCVGFVFVSNSSLQSMRSQPPPPPQTLPPAPTYYTLCY